MARRSATTAACPRPTAPGLGVSPRFDVLGDPVLAFDTKPS